MHVINYDLPDTQFGGIQEYVHRIGRTARIGNVGLATSFYNDKNEDIAEALVRILLETDQEIPDFLQTYKPEDTENLQFDDDTDNEGEEANAAASGDNPPAAAGSGGMWGAPVEAAGSGSAWGASKPADDPWGTNKPAIPAAPVAAAPADPWGTSASAASASADPWGAPKPTAAAQAAW